MKLCSYCFERHEEWLVECPHCSYVEGDGAKELYHLFPGTRLKDRYLVGQVLGFGGFGITYKVWDENLKTVWAIKEYFPSGLTNRTPGTKEVNVFSGSRLRAYNHGLMRFVDEARSMAKFNAHKNIINVMEYFEENNTAYIVMEYLDGITLSEFLKSNRMDFETSIEVISHILSALKDIHQMGIIHRDVSPDNIFVCTNGVVKLIDFGAARFSSNEAQQRTIILKPGFAPPEQYERVNIQGPWTDIYAVGATLYYMLVGTKPEESTNRKIDDNVVAPHLIKNSIPEYVSNAVMQAMAIDRNMRFSNVMDFEKGLKREKEVLPLEKQIKRKKYRRFFELAAVFVVIVVSSGLFFTNWNRQRQAETLPNASISIAFTLTGDDSLDTARKTAFSDIIDSFRASFPNVYIAMRTYLQEEYEGILLQALSDGSLPTLFESTGLHANLLANTRVLTGVVNRISEGTMHFLEQHSLHFPAQNQLPLGFNAPALFINTVLSDFESAGWDFGDFYSLAQANNSDEMDYVISGTDEDARNLFVLGLASAYFTDTSAYFFIQSSMPARYRLLYVNCDRPQASFSDLWSISSFASPNEIAAAERFLLFLLSDHAQDILHIRTTSGSLPINAYALGVFSLVYSDFYGFFNNIDSFVFTE